MIKKIEVSTAARRSQRDFMRPSKRTHTIMIIDDDSVSGSLYRTILEWAGQSVVTVSTGSEGLAHLKRAASSPDLIFVDCVMPEMNGETFLKKLKVMRPQTFSESKIVGLTSHDSTSPVFKRIKSLAFDCRQKPSRIDEFLDLVSDYLNVKITDGFVKRPETRKFQLSERVRA